MPDSRENMQILMKINMKIVSNIENTNIDNSPGAATMPFPIPAVAYLVLPLNTPQTANADCTRVMMGCIHS